MINHISFQGRFTAAPELKKTQSDISFADFDIAWSEKRNEVETKCFLRCRAWRQTAEFISKYFTKGDMVVIEGRLITNQWTDQQGQKHSMTVCDVDRAHFCGAKQNGGNAAQGASTGAQPGNQGGYMPNAYANTASVPAAPQFETVSDGDLPF